MKKTKEELIFSIVRNNHPSKIYDDLTIKDKNNIEELAGKNIFEDFWLKLEKINNVKNSKNPLDLIPSGIYKKLSKKFNVPEELLKNVETAHLYLASSYLNDNLKENIEREGKK